MQSISHGFISILYAFLAGIVPAIIWLIFWNQEKKDHPEPKRMITLAFSGGMLTVFIALFIEKYFFGIDPNVLFHAAYLEPVLAWLKGVAAHNNISIDKLLLVVLFAPIIEEFLKFIAAYALVLRGKDDDEPIDPMIYMIATALGFAAMENTLFMIDPISKNDIITSVLIGNIRFLGSTLLHTVSSATIGIFISFNFFERKFEEGFWAIIGIFAAIGIHAVFNFYMIVNTNYFAVLEVIWIVVIIVLLAFEKIKRVKLEKI